MLVGIRVDAEPTCDRAVAPAEAGLVVERTGENTLAVLTGTADLGRILVSPTFFSGGSASVKQSRAEAVKESRWPYLFSHFLGSFGDIGRVLGAIVARYPTSATSQSI